MTSSPNKYDYSQEKNVYTLCHWHVNYKYLFLEQSMSQ